MTLKKVSLDPLAKATAEVEDVISFVRRAVPMFRRAVGVLQDLSGLLQEQGAPIAVVPTSLPCLTCGGSGNVGMTMHTVTCPVCGGRGVQL